MKANELRIGNWIQASAYLQIDARFIYEYDMVGGDYKPIPLTDEWLLKFGWELTPLNASFKRYNRKSGFMIIEVYDDNKFWTEYIYVKYVHQLQNLYFALTGEELTIS